MKGKHISRKAQRTLQRRAGVSPAIPAAPASGCIIPPGLEGFTAYQRAGLEIVRRKIERTEPMRRAYTSDALAVVAIYQLARLFGMAQAARVKREMHYKTARWAADHQARRVDRLYRFEAITGLSASQYQLGSAA